MKALFHQIDRRAADATVFARMRWIVSCVLSYLSPYTENTNKTFVIMNKDLCKMSTLYGKIEIYTTMFCPFCVQAKQLLDSKQVMYDEIDVTARLSLRKTMTRRANGRTSVPQIFINGQHIGGCNELVALQQSGQLDRLLQLAC